MPRKGTKQNGVKKSQGIGDTIEKITEATGVKALVEKVFPDCGCQDRKEWLNKTFPYVNKQKQCMNEEQYLFFKAFREKHLSGSLQVAVPGDEMTKLIDLYNSIFQVDVQGCSDCNAGHFVKKLEQVYLSYEKDNEKV